jgi:NADH dehydrogenase FAD-containing subunit
VPVKPINQFIAHWQSMFDRILARDNGVRVGVVGTGAGGVEILLSVARRIPCGLAF